LAEWAKGGQPSRGAASSPAADQAVSANTPQGEAETAEVSSEIIAEIDHGLAAAAENGTAALKTELATIHPKYEPYIRSALDRRHKPRAKEVDQTREQVS